MTRLRTAAWIALALFLVPAVLRLGIWSPQTLAIDAVSAVTPGYVAVVGAGSPTVPGAPASPTVADLVRGACYLAGGLHKVIDADARQILVRPGHAPMDAAALARHVELVRAVVVLLHEIAPEAQVGLLVGGAPGSGVGASAPLRTALQGLAATPDLAGGRLSVIAVGDEEFEAIEVPDGGELADVYPVAVSLLECDALVNAARYDGPMSGLRNLRGLAGPPEGLTSGGDPDLGLVDLALLAEAEFTLLDLLGPDDPRNPLILASPDGVAVDRLAEALAGRPEVPSALRRAGARNMGMVRLSSIKIGGLQVDGTWVPDGSAP